MRSHTVQVLDGEALNNAKELIVTVDHASQMLDLRHITHLILFPSPALVYSFKNSLLPTATHLQEIHTLTVPNSDSIEETAFNQANCYYSKIRSQV